MEVWHILITIGIVAFIFEIFTAGFISASVGIGFIFAAIGNYLELEVKWQILLFSLGLILTYFLIRPIMQKVGYNKDLIKTNHDALVGKTGRVTQEINTKENTGRVAIDGDDWKAATKNNEIISIGATVKVVALESIILIVEPLN
ncbi:MAG: NfeD family protein [Bacteroidales bacterium]|nr:NfeD family protein [Bacteroidales bacterium]